MDLLDRIIEGNSLSYHGRDYKILGKTFYVAQKSPSSIYAKILLEDHHVLVISQDDEIAYFGKNLGRLCEFDTFDPIVSYCGKQYKQVNTDYQIVVNIAFGSPLIVEGEVRFWDYEAENDDIISIAIISRNSARADIVAKYLKFSDISI